MAQKIHAVSNSWDPFFSHSALGIEIAVSEPFFFSTTSLKQCFSEHAANELFPRWKSLTTNWFKWRKSKNKIKKSICKQDCGRRDTHNLQRALGHLSKTVACTYFMKNEWEERKTGGGSPYLSSLIYLFLPCSASNRRLRLQSVIMRDKLPPYRRRDSRQRRYIVRHWQTKPGFLIISGFNMEWKLENGGGTV